MSDGTNTRPRGPEDEDGEMRELFAAVDRTGVHRGGAVDRAAVGPGTVAGADLDAILQQVEGRIAQGRRAPAWWLRSRPTFARRALASVTFAVVAALTVAVVPREDLGVYPTWRLVLELVVLGVLLGACLGVALRPLHQPALARWKLAGLLGLAATTALVVALLPAAHQLHPASLGGEGAGLLPEATPCFLFGAMLALPVYAAVRLLDRGSLWSTVLAGGAAGLAGNFALQLHCPLTSPLHAVTGHFTVLLAFVAVAWLVRALERRRLTRGSADHALR